jgi:hypothetical protein
MHNNYYLTALYSAMSTIAIILGSTFGGLIVITVIGLVIYIALGICVALCIIAGFEIKFGSEMTAKSRVLIIYIAVLLIPSWPIAVLVGIGYVIMRTFGGCYRNIRSESSEVSTMGCNV